MEKTVLIYKLLKNQFIFARVDTIPQLLGQNFVKVSLVWRLYLWLPWKLATIMEKTVLLYKSLRNWFIFTKVDTKPQLPGSNFVNILLVWNLYLWLPWRRAAIAEKTALLYKSVRNRFIFTRVDTKPQLLGSNFVNTLLLWNLYLWLPWKQAAIMEKTALLYKSVRNQFIFTRVDTY